ncbi:ROK family protein [Agromyces sp. NPDC058484]|uniref:ROK family transcriptional regulator n=1 Tax=Agromyces sp. NPDC058484 TaxID=3346524 RepID=UPI00364F08B4
MTGPAVGTAVLKQLNTVRVLEDLRRRDEPVRISEVAAAARLTRPTVVQILDELSDRGWVVHHDPLESLGRPAQRVAVDPGAFTVLGIDIGPHRIAAEVSDARGAALAFSSERHEWRSAGDVLRLCGTVIEEVLSTAGVDPAQVRAITVASIGVIEDNTKVHYARGIAEWSRLDLTRALGEYVGGAISIENDANLAARAMRDLPNAPPSFLTVQWGERLGAGLLLDGRVFRGRASAAGEIGALRVTDPWNGATTGLEEVVGAARIASIVREEVAGLPQSALAIGLDRQDPTEAVFRLATAGDPLAVGIVREVALIVARALAPICLALDLDRVFVTGGIARAGDAVAAALQHGLTEFAASPITVEVSPLAENTVVRGAVSSAIDEAWDILYRESAMPPAPPSTATA